jgi:hypothetical protein
MGHDNSEEPDFLPLLEEGAPLSDRLVDAVLASPRAADPSRTQRIRRIFVRRLLEELHPTPVRTVEKIWSFGRWIEAIRKSIGLDQADVACAIEVDTDFVQRLERSDVLPWTLGTRVIADLVCLFRLHITAVEQLFATSQVIFNRQHTTNAVARSSAFDWATRGDSARRALDLYLAATSKPFAGAPPPGDAVQDLKRELQSRGAEDLLRT